MNVLSATRRWVIIVRMITKWPEMLTGLSVYPQQLPDGAKGKLSRLRTDRHDSVSHKL